MLSFNVFALAQLKLVASSHNGCYYKFHMHHQETKLQETAVRYSGLCMKMCIQSFYDHTFLTVNFVSIEKKKGGDRGGCCRPFHFLFISWHF